MSFNSNLKLKNISLFVLRKSRIINLKGTEREMHNNSRPLWQHFYNVFQHESASFTAVPNAKISEEPSTMELVVNRIPTIASAP